MVLPGGGVVASVAHDGDLDDLNGVHEDGGDDQGHVPRAIVLAAVAEPQPDRQGEHGKKQESNKEDMLPGQIALGLAGVSVNTEKFFHGMLLSGKVSTFRHLCSRKREADHPTAIGGKGHHSVLPHGCEPLKRSRSRVSVYKIRQVHYSIETLYLDV